MYLAAIQTHLFIQSLEHIVGFLFVLLALTTLWAVSVLVSLFFKRTKPSPVASPVVLSGAGGNPAEDEIAAIAACVATVLGPRSRVVSVRSSSVDWNREGRREHFASHKIR